MGKNVRKIIGLLCAAGLCAFCGWLFYHYEKTEGLRMVKKMGAGINLGNTLDPEGVREYKPEATDLDFETEWGNPRADKETFHAIAEAGFGTVRIPVTWADHMDEDFQISKVWIDRVQEVVDMALDEGLYVILDTHHEKWLNLELENEAEITEHFRIVWRQIAERFATYDGHLLFEGMNEPRLRDTEYEWTAGTGEMQDMVNRLNRVFVETVRETGGNNAERYLLIVPYCSSNQEDALRKLEIPDKKTIVSFHMYAPYEFCQKEHGHEKWDKDNPDDRDEIEHTFSLVRKLFIQNGVPAILTEFGCKDKDNLETRVSWTEFYVEQAKRNHVGYIWWDCEEYHLMDRETKTWEFPEIVTALTASGREGE